MKLLMSFSNKSNYLINKKLDNWISINYNKIMIFMRIAK